MHTLESSAASHFWPRAIAHADLDQFYAAVEILDFPELKGRPLIVGGLPGGRGVVCTASYEARKFGVHSAMASSRAAQLCPNALWRVPRMERYAEKSREVFSVFAAYTDQIEPLSLDEAFLDLTGSQALFGPPEQIARKIKEQVLRETGLMISVGVAANKFLAKVASDLRKPNGLVAVPPESSAAEFLAPLPVSRLWGAGPKTCETLNHLGFVTIGQLAGADEAWLARRLGGPAAAHLLQLSRGEDARPVESGERPKSVGRENTFASDLHDFGHMERELLGCADEVAAALRRKNLRCLCVTLKVRLADFSRLTRALRLAEPADVAEPLYHAAVEMLRTRVDLKGRGVRLLGISASHLTGPGEVTATLFPDEHAGKQRSVAQTLDRLRARFGSDAVTRARLLEGRARTTGTPPDGGGGTGDGV